MWKLKNWHFFAKGLVHNFDQKFEVSLPSLFLAKFIKKSVWQCS